jgi:hypothetical protein
MCGADATPDTDANPIEEKCHCGEKEFDPCLARQEDEVVAALGRTFQGDGQFPSRSECAADPACDFYDLLDFFAFFTFFVRHNTIPNSSIDSPCSRAARLK